MQDANETNHFPSEKGPMGRLRRWVFRILLYFLFCVILLLGTGVLVLQTSFVQTKLRSFLAEIASTSLNATVTIEDMEGSLLSDLTLRKIRLALPDSTPVLSIESLSVRYLLPKLFFNTIHIDRLSVNGLYLDLIKSTDGEWMLPTISSTSRVEDSDNAAPFPFRVDMVHFDLADSQITFRRDVSATSVTIKHLSGKFEYGKSILLSILDSSLSFNPPEVPQLALSGNFSFDPVTSDLTIDGLSLNGGESQVFLDGNCRFSESIPVFSFSLTGSSLHLAELSEFFSLPGLPDAAVSVSLHATGTPNDFKHDLSIELDGAAIESEGSSGFDKGRGLWADFTAGIRDLDLSKVWLPSKDMFSGTVSSDFQVNATGLQSIETIDIDASADLSGPAVFGVLLDSVRLSASFSGERLSIEQFDASSGQNRLKVSGHFNLATREVNAILALDLDQADALLDPLSKGYLNVFHRVSLGEGTTASTVVQGFIDQPSALFSIAAQDVSFDSYHADTFKIEGKWEGLPGPEHRLEDITLAIGDISSDRISATNLRFEGNWYGWIRHPLVSFSLNSDNVSLFSYQANHLDLKGLWKDLPGPENRIENIDLSLLGVTSDPFQAESLSLRGDWNGWLQNPNTAFSISAQEISNDRIQVDALELSARLHGHPSADTAASEFMVYSNGIRLDDVQARALKISGNLQGPLKAPSGIAALEAEGASLFGEQFTQFSLDGNISPDSAIVSLSANHENGSTAEIEGAISPFRAEKKVVTLNKLRFSTTSPWPEAKLSNTDPLRFSLKGDVLTVEDCRLSVNEATLSVRGGLSPTKAMGLNVQANNLEIVTIPGAWNDRAGFSGTVSADATLNGPWNRPSISSDLQVKHLTGYGISQTTDLSITATYDDALASVQATLTRQEAKILSADGRIPLSISLRPFSIDTDQGSLEAAISTQNLRFSELPIPKSDRIEWDAVADMNLSLSGNVLDPDVNGNLLIRDGHLALTRNKLTYETIEGSILFSKNSVNIDNLLIEGDREGRLMVNGAVFLHEGYEFDADLTLGGSNFYIPFQKAITARISPDLHLSGGLKDPRLTGEVTLNESKINLDRLSRQQRSDIQVVESSDFGNDSQLLIESQSGGVGLLSPLAADIRVRVPKNAWLKGQDVNAEISGDITVSKKPGESFVLTGPLNTLRGNYYFMGKNFQLTKGNLEFLGLKEINPNLNIEAKTRIKSTDIIVTLGGSARDLTVDLSSDPAMDESDIISYLVFGRPTDSLGGDQAFSVEKAAVNYVGGILAVELRDLLGGVEFIDTFSVDPGSSENGFGSLTFGKYVTPELFISRSQSLSENEPSYQQITYELTPSIKLESQVGRDYSNSVDLTWEFDF